MPEENAGGNPAEHPEHAATEGNLSAAASHVQAGMRQAMAETGLEREGPSLATATLLGVGAALIEPELIPGLLIGAGAVLAPKMLPAFGKMLRPVIKGAVKAGYSATVAVREMAAEAGENIEDMIAEARAEHEVNAPSGAEHPSAPQEPQKRQRRQPRPGPTPSPTPAVNL